MIGTSTGPLTLTPREQSLLLENEQMREELVSLRALREAMTPKVDRWYALGLSRASTLLLDVLWNATHPLTSEQLFQQLNLAREKGSYRVLKEPQSVNVLMHRLRKPLGSKLRTPPINVLVGQGYFLTPEARAKLEGWMR